jgi:GTPase SAR1 family protein
MGAAAAKLRALGNKKKTTRLLMIGLDAAGKSTILYKLKLGEVTAVNVGLLRKKLFLEEPLLNL